MSDIGTEEAAACADWLRLRRLAEQRCTDAAEAKAEQAFQLYRGKVLRRLGVDVA